MSLAASSRRAFLLAASAAGVAGCGALGGWTLGYRLTLRITAFGETFTSAGMYKLRITRNSGAMESLAGRYNVGAWGEAIPIDFGARGVLVGVLGNVAARDRVSFFDPKSIVKAMLQPALPTPEEWESGEAFERIRRVEGDRPWPREQWPQLLYFADRHDQSSVRFIAPTPEHRASRNTPVTSLAGMFEGARVESVTGRMVAFPRTDNLIQWVLPFVSRLPGAGFGRYTLPGPGAPLAQRLKYLDFRLRGWS